jgi:hypothetical protein
MDLWHLRSQMEIITTEEYEAARQASPELCRPMTKLLGDNRSASELCGSHPLDTWSGWLSTEQGRRKVQAFAEVSALPLPPHETLNPKPETLSLPLHP